MKRILLLSTALLLILLAAAATAGDCKKPCVKPCASADTETVAGLPLHIKQLPGGAIRLWLGDHISSTGVVAIPSEKGILVIDTSGMPEVDKKLRKVIARELGRDDFKYLINTHEHGDHVGGNAVYADCTIIGHENVKKAMLANGEPQQRIIDWYVNRIAELEKEVAELATDDPDADRIREDLQVKKLEFAAYENRGEPVPPTKTFSDRMKLELGDVTCEMYYIGGMHSSSDIAVLVPELGLLMTGDTMADTWLTETPGCLASFVVRQGVEHDFPKLLKNWNDLLARRAEIDLLLPGHWNGELSIDGFEQRVRYVEAMWDATRQEVENDGSLQALVTSTPFADRFPQLVGSPGCSAGNHGSSLAELWSTVSGQMSAAQVLYDLIEEGADDAKLKAVAAEFAEAKPDYYFIESQINGFGYRFLQLEKPAEAVRLFGVNAKLYPDSWNVYDSLAEALLATGEKDQAIAMYEKSVELNPENENGKTALAAIRGEVAVN